MDLQVNFVCILRTFDGEGGVGIWPFTAACKAAKHWRRLTQQRRDFLSFATQTTFVANAVQKAVFRVSGKKLSPAELRGVVFNQSEEPPQPKKTDEFNLNNSASRSPQEAQNKRIEEHLAPAIVFEDNKIFI